ncbi:winged helix-turn-helix transcriptional regulator [Ilumatobacter sp.]|uniref:winged helix-turn-helix transcriptional regulator n=1 Tax=Ilumatobacter sp. TaxID=1967498 RepID=UPI003C374F8F
MLPNHYEGQDCSIARALEILGERWTLLILREAFLGSTHFDEFEQRLEIAPSTLTRRLDLLIAEGLLERSADPNDGRSHLYRLTAKGSETHLVITALRDWGESYYSHGAPPDSLTHDSCGGRVRAELRCERCGDPIGIAETRRTEHRPRTRTTAP